MPPKRFKRFKGSTKEEILVTSRLMAISLVVDDYIYKNKPISLIEAMKFDEEISSLKIKCNQDTRSLQVVEKLKIFMKSIIKEQSTDRLQDNTSSFLTETCVDNNTLIVLNNISEDVENNITNTPQTNSKELFKNTESESSESNNIAQDINTQKKVSINIINPVISVSTEIKHVESNDIITPNNSTSKINGKSEENIIDTSKNIDFDKNDCLAYATNEKEKEKSNFVTLTSSNLPEPPGQEKTCLHQTTQKPDAIVTGIKKQRNTAKKITRNENKIAPKNNIKTNTNKQVNNTNKDLENKSSGENKLKKKPMKKTQINISWVENMKFVREVSPDEHTNLQIEDNFWSNLSLPGIWNSNDFD